MTVPDSAEERLLSALKSGDRAARKAFFEGHHSFIFTLCWRLCGSREDAEDATQDVFVRIFSSLEQFRRESSLKTWIYRIAVNTCLQLIRRRKLERIVSLDFLEQTDKRKKEPALTCPDQVGDDLELAQVQRLVKKAIDGLPPRQRSALVLQRYEGLALDEIAMSMGIGRGAVESLLHRAKAGLAEKLVSLKTTK